MGIFPPTTTLRATGSLSGESKTWLLESPSLYFSPNLERWRAMPHSLVSYCSTTATHSSHRPRATWVVTLAVLCVASLASSSWAASMKVLHSFKDGFVPQAGLVSDAAGNLYGTTSGGGVYDKGTVFELTLKANGRWTEKVLLSFHGAHGALPRSSLIFDASGNLYGTTYGGGKQTCSSGCGTVFKLSPKAGGAWTEQVLYRFKGSVTDGSGPEAVLIFDGSGSIYGTTTSGGTAGVGTVFELTPRSGSWTEKVVYSFLDGGRPYGGLVLDAAGILYGTTGSGGSYGYGAVFKLTPKAGGRWAEKVIHSFNRTDGYLPLSGLTFDDSGNLYGTTFGGGAYGYGTVFELTPKTGGGWTENVLQSFSYLDGSGPAGSLIFDAAGNLYGTTYSGGSGDCQYGCGTVFELAPLGGGVWTEFLLVDFQDTADPAANVILGSWGELYGTTSHGGNYGGGSVFETTSQ